MEVYELKVKSNTENLEKIGDFVNSKLRNKVDYETLQEILIAVDEAATNIILHAYKRNPDKWLKIRIEYQEDKVILSLFDEGEPFDPSKVSPPDFKKNLSERKIGGLGIFLMKKFMDEVKYIFKSNNKKENEVRMIKYLKRRKKDGNFN